MNRYFDVPKHTLITVILIKGREHMYMYQSMYHSLRWFRIEAGVLMSLLKQHIRAQYHKLNTNIIAPRWFCINSLVHADKDIVLVTTVVAWDCSVYVRIQCEVDSSWNTVVCSMVSCIVSVMQLYMVYTTFTHCGIHTVVRLCTSRTVVQSLMNIEVTVQAESLATLGTGVYLERREITQKHFDTLARRWKTVLDKSGNRFWYIDSTPVYDAYYVYYVFPCFDRRR